MIKQKYHLQCPCCGAFAKLSVPPNYEPTEEDEFEKDAFFGKLEVPQVVCPRCRNIFWVAI